MTDKINKDHPLVILTLCLFHLILLFLVLSTIFFDELYLKFTPKLLDLIQNLNGLMGLILFSEVHIQNNFSFETNLKR
jgi:hypothetical protein